MFKMIIKKIWHVIKTILKPTKKKVLFVIYFSVLAIIVSHLEIKYRYAEHYFHSVDDAPRAQVALILGARVYDHDTFSSIYMDRINTALELYRSGKVEKLLVSGDHGQDDYDEVNAAKDYLLGQGVDGGDIFLDHAGFDTYDSLYRAQYIFGTNDVLIVTQAFHLPRAVYIGRRLGLEADGVVADKMEYRDALRNRLRESLARVKAIKDVLFHAGPRFLGEKIPLSGDSKLSWD